MLELVEELKPEEPQVISRNIVDMLIEKIPIDQQWILQLLLEKQQKANEGRTIFYEFGYREQGRVVWYDSPKKHIDSKQQSTVPMVPQKYRVVEHVPGEGFVTQEHEGVRNIDPDIKTAILINKLADLL